LGGTGFIDKLRIPKATMDREIPRYHRRALQVDPRRVIGKVAGLYGIAEVDVLSGMRGRENEARKVAMYLVTRCCDRTLREAASLFGLSSYGAVGWSCHGVKAKREREKRFREQIERIVAG
jgi:chromosomal replication initiation ATPase DnaA